MTSTVHSFQVHLAGNLRHSALQRQLASVPTRLASSLSAQDGEYDYDLVVIGGGVWLYRDVSNL